MAHPRQLVRDAFVTALTGATAAGASVESTRVLRYRRDQLPAVLVYFETETVEADSHNSSPRYLERTVSIVVEGWVQQAAGVEIENALDDLALEIETAIDADPYLGGVIGDLGARLDDTTAEVREEGQQLLGLVALTYLCEYETQLGVTPADDFDTSETTYNLANEVDPGDEAVDVFNADPDA